MIIKLTITVRNLSFGEHHSISGLTCRKPLTQKERDSREVLQDWTDGVGVVVMLTPYFTAPALCLSAWLYFSNHSGWCLPFMVSVGNLHTGVCVYIYWQALARGLIASTVIAISIEPTELFFLIKVCSEPGFQNCAILLYLFIVVLDEMPWNKK